MKAFTDIEQSKKLAEILPIESADFHFSANSSPKGYLEKPIWGNPEYADYNCLPCWSLAALLEIIGNIRTVNERIVTIEVGKYAGNNKWYVEFVFVMTESKELIDACYEMIIKAHEQKLL